MSALNKISQLGVAVFIFTPLFLVTACGGGSRPEPIRAVPAYSYTPSQQYQMQQLQQNPYQQQYQQPNAYQQNPYQNMPYAAPTAPVTAAPSVPMQQAPAAVRPAPIAPSGDNDELYYPRYFYD